MGCFPKCFPPCNRRKHKQSVTFTPFKHQSLEAAEEVAQIPPAEPTKLEDFINAIKPIKESEEENEEEPKSGGKKKVTFDMNVSSTKEVINGLVEICDENENDKEIEPILGSIVSSSSSAAAAAASQLLNHRYENCKNSEDEDGEFESSKHMLVQEESSESLFSLSTDSWKQEVCDAETDEKEVNSPMPKQAIGSNPKNLRDRGQNCHSVLTPIENLAQWKEEVREKATPRASKQQQEKENIKVEQDCHLPFCPESILKLSKLPKSSDDEGARVDTSLSRCLVESETTPMSNASDDSVRNNSNSPRSHEDRRRPILGAWTSEEHRQLSVSSTPKRPQSPTPGEMPVIGTVGSYWIRTGQAMDSDSSSSSTGMPKTAKLFVQDQKVKWKPTPFEAKLERALDMGLLEA